MPSDALFSHIVTTDELLEATGPGAWLAALLDAEAALARAEADTGVIPAEAAEAIAAACRADLFDPEEIGRQARAGGNPVIPLVARLVERTGAGGKDFVHWGATSQDILDTAAVLVARRAGRIIADDLCSLADGCAVLADRHRHSVMTGRTLLQPALPITFGFKAAGWLVGVTDCRGAVDRALAGLAVQLGGATGTLASLGSAGPAVAAAFARQLDLPEPVMPWHSSRQRMVALAAALGQAAGSAAKISGDVALLMQDEVAEAFEPAADCRGGSSTLPHKRNPVGAAAVGAAARRASALVGLFFGSLAGEHERPLVAWPVEWQSLGELLALAGGAVARTAETVGGLEVDVAAMSGRAESLAGALLAERVSLVLAARMGRAEARTAVAEAGRRASGTGAAQFAAALLTNTQVAAVLPAGELEEMLQPAGYLGATGIWIDRALAYHRGSETGD
ncbi:MAG TPA: 3-carboxy-cis,cis-muconate cycloisomerase [Acidimicrobiales bacterium]|nr:3-carboxy-cis,cis-muconate cycloisomerase [Acidimicrobiales bacterium]